MNPDEARRTLVATMSRLGMTETDLGAPRATIQRRAPARITQGRLPPLMVSHDPIATNDTADLRVRKVVARGGMGVVHSAAQASLNRDVALKTARKDDQALQLSLIREAQIVGALEHPNIVPVHALGINEDGTPVLVMKLIDGVTWRTLLDDPRHPMWEVFAAGHGSHTRANGEILMQVARALELAHSKGVVHRDIKPDNVMIGRFGEVYLVDWGIALRLEERDHEPEGIVGTPAYLAPEMALGDIRQIGVHTDIYLLGAVLFEVATGRPPHQSDTPMAALVSAMMEVEIPAGVPQDVAELLRAALAVDPKRRPPNVETFRAAVARHQALHAADVLVESAEKLIARADRLLAEEGSGSVEAGRALIEARFAFRSVLDTYDGPHIRERHDEVVRRLIERELALGNRASARSVARELLEPDAQLTAMLDA